MKKKYGNKGSRSSRKSQRRARRKERQETERTIQLSLPLVELLASAQESLGRLVVDVGTTPNPEPGCVFGETATASNRPASEEEAARRAASRTSLGEHLGEVLAVQPNNHNQTNQTNHQAYRQCN